MSMSTRPIKNNSLYVSNPDTISILYSLLKASQWGKKTPEVVISTQAGQFSLERSEAERLHGILKDWDAHDGHPDGTILETTVHTKLLKPFNERKIPPGEFGFKIAFKQFDPSPSWQANYKWLNEAFQKGRLIPFTAIDFAHSQDDLWRAATLATFSGITPEVHKLANELCQSDRSCAIYWCLHDHSLAILRSSTRSPDLGIKIYFNLSKDLDTSSLRPWIIHEYGHLIYKEVAKKAKRRGFAAHVLHWAKNQKDFRSIAEHYERYYRAQQNTEDRWNLRYLLEEVADVSFMAYVSPESIKLWKDEWMKNYGVFAILPQEQFDKQMIDLFSDPKTTAFYLAWQLHRAEKLKIDPKIIAEFRKRTERMLQAQGPEYLDAYYLLSATFEIALAYASTPEFKAIVDQTLPPHFFIGKAGKVSDLP